MKAKTTRRPQSKTRSPKRAANGKFTGAAKRSEVPPTGIPTDTPLPSPPDQPGPPIGSQPPRDERCRSIQIPFPLPQKRLSQAELAEVKRLKDELHACDDTKLALATEIIQREEEIRALKHELDRNHTNAQALLRRIEPLMERLP
jgi:hypothetical protein